MKSSVPIPAREDQRRARTVNATALSMPRMSARRRRRVFGRAVVGSERRPGRSSGTCWIRAGVDGVDGKDGEDGFRVGSVLQASASVGGVGGIVGAYAGLGSGESYVSLARWCGERLLCAIRWREQGFASGAAGPWRGRKCLLLVECERASDLGQRSNGGFRAAAVGLLGCGWRWRRWRGIRFG